MKNTLIVILFIVLKNISIYAEDNFRFSDNNAGLPDKNDYYISLFTFSEYSLNDKYSISLHPLTIFVAPSAELKYNFYSDNEFKISTLHSISYPSFLMSLVKNSGTGGFISPEFDIPTMFSISNGVISTLKIDEINYLSAMLKIEFALNNSSLNPATSIDIPVVFPRMAVLYKNLNLNLTIITENQINKHFNFDGSISIFMFPLSDNNIDFEYPEHSNIRYFTELNTNLVWKAAKSVNIIGGIKLCYGEYPFGEKWHLLPNLNLIIY